MKDIGTYCPKDRKDWRKWLQKNHAATPSVWLVLYKKESGKPTIMWSDAVSEALCFGWVDSKRMSLDSEKFIQFFSKRKPGGTWSKVNKDKVSQLIEEGLMMKAGMAAIETSKKNGCWTILDDVEAMKIPADLAKAFKANPGSHHFFLSLSKSVRKTMLQWIVLAKRTETRQQRIADIAALAGQGLKPRQFR